NNVLLRKLDVHQIRRPEEEEGIRDEEISKIVAPEAQDCEGCLTSQPAFPAGALSAVELRRRAVPGGLFARQVPRHYAASTVDFTSINGTDAETVERPLPSSHRR